MYDLTAEEVIAKCRAREITSKARACGIGAGWLGIGFRSTLWRPIREFPDFAPHVSDTTPEKDKRAADALKLYLAEHSPDPNAHCYLLIGDKREGPFLPAQIRSMWNAGTITADTQFINSDLPDWRPVKSFCQSIQSQERQSTEAALVEQTAASQRKTAKNTNAIRWLGVLFLIVAGVCAIGGFNNTRETVDETSKRELIDELNSDKAKAVTEFLRAGAGDASWLLADKSLSPGIRQAEADLEKLQNEREVRMIYFFVPAGLLGIVGLVCCVRH